MAFSRKYMRSGYLAGDFHKRVPLRVTVIASYPPFVASRLLFASTMSKQPAGLSEGLVEITSGGDSNWRELAPLKHYTNAFVWNKNTGKVV